MTDQTPSIAPTEISLHKKSRLLEVAFSDGTRFKYPCEYLRVFSPAGGLQGLDQPLHGKRMVDIQAIEPRGTSALQLDFDDGYSCSCSWSTLHDLGVNYAHNWHVYLQKLAQYDLPRGAGRAVGGDGRVSVRLLYFIQLAGVSGKDEEDVEIPESVTDVAGLLAWLRKRGDDWNEAFAADRVRVTVNKQFAESFTLVEHGDEVAIVPQPE